MALGTFLRGLWPGVAATVGLALIGACQTASTVVDGDAYARRPAVQVSGSGAFRRVELKTRPGVIQPFQLNVPANARAIAVYFPGAEGVGGSIGHNWNLPAHGIGFVLIFPPSDLPYGFRENGRRSGSGHAADVAAVIRYLRAEYRLPVWLLGISMGSVSATNLALHGGDVAGVVLLSPVTAFSASGRRVFGETLVTEFPLDRMAMPLLVVSHRRDGCAMTPPAGAEKVVRAATAATVARTVRFEEGYESSNDPCTGASYHTFAGLTTEVGEAVAAFVLANAPAATN